MTSELGNDVGALLSVITSNAPFRDAARGLVILFEDDLLLVKSKIYTLISQVNN